MAPNEPFTILEPQNPLHDVPELNKTRRYLDREALKLWKGLSGSGIAKRSVGFLL